MFLVNPDSEPWFVQALRGPMRDPGFSVSPPIFPDLRPLD
jgi:hypothetical protein